jgi:hypothetical protein
MYTDTAFRAVFCAVPGFITPISCPSSITTRHVSVSQGSSSGVYIVERKLLHSWHTDHTPSIIFCLYYLLKIQKFKIKKLCDVVPLLMSLIYLLVVWPACTHTCKRLNQSHQDIYRHTSSTSKHIRVREASHHKAL